MQKTLFYKILIIGLMLLVIAVPLGMIGNLVSERQHRQAEAVRDVANSYAGAQQLIGPVLVLPYVETYLADETKIDADGQKRKQQVLHRFERTVHILPAELKIGGEVDTRSKRRGLFKVLIYAWQSKIDGSFQIPEKLAFPRDRPDSQITWGEAYVAVGVGDTRGVSGTPQLDFNGRRIGFERGSRVSVLGAGMHAPVGVLEPGRALTLPFHLDLSLNGTESLSVAPLADSNQIRLASSWPHPSFGGRFLPEAQSQEIGPKGFKAEWNISALASNAGPQFLKAVAANEKCINCMETLDVRLVEPVNIYVQSDRALKYGFLFVGLSFAAFFLFEILRRLPIHPAQYFLIGLGLALFFLLVLSLSEHIAFASAYLAAAIASIGLMTYYLSHVLRSRWRGLGFGAMLSLLFGTLYVLLASEDNALVMGSVLLFALLAAAMVATRKLDWYRLGSGEDAAEHAA